MCDGGIGDCTGVIGGGDGGCIGVVDVGVDRIKFHGLMLKACGQVELPIDLIGEYGIDSELLLSLKMSALMVSHVGTCIAAFLHMSR